MQYFKLTSIYIFFLVLSLPIYAQNKASGINAFANNPALKHALVGVSIKDMSGKNIVSLNADKAYTPASVLKIVTTATALELLGADYTYQTTLSKDDKQNHHLFVHGYGDPTLGTTHFDNVSDEFLGVWADEIKKAFPNSKNLNITIVDNYFGYEGISERWIRQDMGNYYAAGAYGISVFDNSYQLFFNTTRRDTCPIIVKTEPRMSDIQFLNTMALNSSGQDNGYIIGEPFSNKRILKGNIPGGRTSFSIKGDIPNPGLYLGQKLSESLVEKNINAKKVETAYDDYFKKSKNEFQPNKDQIFYTHNSFPLSEIIQNVNFRSNNHYAEHLIRTIGREKNKDIYSPPLEEGVNKIEEFWENKGLNTKTLFMYDGSGLAPSNAISPDLMCDILIYMQTKSKNGDTFLKSIPQAGKEGTVKNLLKGTKLVGKIYAKSGSIVNVQCYAGYYVSGGKKYAFTIMVNNHNSPRNQVVKAIEQLLLAYCN